MSNNAQSSKDICTNWLAGQCNDQSQQNIVGSVEARSEQELLSRLRVANLMLVRPIPETEVAKLVGLPSVESWETHPIPAGATAVAGPRGHICFVYDDEKPDPKAPAFAAPAQEVSAKELERISFVSRTLLKPGKQLSEEQLKAKANRSE
eukprot:g2929.t1